MDLILRGANLPDGRTRIDIAGKGGKIAAVEAGIGASAAREIDVTGRLVSPPFVDSHFHMDATLLYGYPRYNESGTLLEGIKLWAELKPSLSHDWYVERALEYCDWAVGPVAAIDQRLGNVSREPRRITERKFPPVAATVAIALGKKHPVRSFGGPAPEPGN